MYGIQDMGIYNFDETVILIGVISSAMAVRSSIGRTKERKVTAYSREWVTVIQNINPPG
jgi:hypothetical protein